MAVKFITLGIKTINDIIISLLKNPKYNFDKEQSELFNNVMEEIQKNTNPDSHNNLNTEQINQLNLNLKNLEEIQEKMIGKLSQEDLELLNSIINQFKVGSKRGLLSKKQIERLESLQNNFNNSLEDYLNNIKKGHLSIRNNFQNKVLLLVTDKNKLTNDLSKLNELPSIKENLNNQQKVLLEKQKKLNMSLEKLNDNTKSIQFFTESMRKVHKYINENSEENKEKFENILSYLEKNKEKLNKISQKELDLLNTTRTALIKDIATSEYSQKYDDNTLKRINALQEYFKKEFSSRMIERTQHQTDLILVSNDLKKTKAALQEITTTEEKLKTTAEKLEVINEQLERATKDLNDAENTLQLTEEKIKKIDTRISRDQLIKEETEDSGKCFCIVVEATTIEEAEEVQILMKACNNILAQTKDTEKTIFLTSTIDKINKFLEKGKTDKLIIPSLKSERTLIEQISEVRHILSYKSEIDANKKMSEPGKNIMLKLCETVLDIKARPSGNELIKEQQIKNAIETAIEESKTIPPDLELCKFINKLVKFFGFVPPFNIHKDVLAQMKKLGLEQKNELQKELTPEEKKDEEDRPIEVEDENNKEIFRRFF